MTTQFNDSERIQRNYCRQIIRHMLIYRFSMRDLRKIARKQGLRKRKSDIDRHVEEFTWFEDRIYEALREPVRRTLVKYEKRLYEPIGSIQITKEDDRDWREFEQVFYSIVK